MRETFKMSHDHCLTRPILGGIQTSIFFLSKNAVNVLIVSWNLLVSYSLALLEDKI